MRSVSAVAAKCAYCLTDLTTLAKSTSVAPGPLDEGPAVRCALCGMMYSPGAHPHGCPHCQTHFTDPVRKAEYGERRRFMWTTLGFRAAAGALAFAVGMLVVTLVDGWLLTFGNFRKVSLIAAGALATIYAWRSYDTAELRDEPAWLVAAISFIAATAGLYPWCQVTATWANGNGLTSPSLLVQCQVKAAEPEGKDSAMYDVACKLDDGTAIAGRAPGPRGILVSERAALRVRRGRLGHFVADGDVEPFIE